jgi:hypothetical protein
MSPLPGTTSAAPTSSAGPVPSLNGILPPERRALWDPGLNAVGGIPDRTTVFTTLSPSGGDDTDAIQAALDACPVDQVIQLGPGTFHISAEGLAITHSNVTLRGSGPATRLERTDDGMDFPVIIIGTRWYKYTAPVALADDAPQGSYSVTLAQATDMQPGQLVTLDEETDPQLTQWGTRSLPGDPSRGWFGEPDRPIGQVMEVQSVNGTEVTFTTPLHIGLQTRYNAHLVGFSDNPGGQPVATVRLSGVEDLYVSGGRGGDGGGNIHLFATAYSWVKDVESDRSIGASVNLDGTFRSVLRDSYLHSTLDPNPGGGGYGIALDNYAADNLIENNISWNFNKVMVMRTTGGGNVIGYNYMEDGWGQGYPTIVEVGLNASHMTTPHYELFEGNQSFNFDSDSVWGNAIDITVFRNDLTALRRSVSPLELSDQNNRRAIGLTVGHWWYSFIGNILGADGQQPTPPGQTSFAYEVDTFESDDPVPMWKLGYNGEDGSAPQDSSVVQSTIRNGNFDYVTNATHWDPAYSQDLPPSLYLTTKPDFFGADAWPWVVPDAPTPQLGELPARVRFDQIHAADLAP